MTIQQLPPDTEPGASDTAAGQAVDATHRTIVLLDLTERLIAANPHVPAGEVLAAVQRRATTEVDLRALESALVVELAQRTG
ncbi:hypothetical protein [Thalassiella azotivora]